MKACWPCRITTISGEHATALIWPVSSLLNSRYNFSIRHETAHEKRIIDQIQGREAVKYQYSSRETPQFFIGESKVNKELEFLADILAQFLAKEDDEVVAKILSRLDIALYTVLSRLPEEKQGEVVFHLFKLREGKLGLMRWTARDIGGLRAVAEIMNRSSPSTESKTLKYIDDHDPHFAEQLRNEMFRFEDIANLSDDHIRRVFNECDPSDLALGLKDCDEDLKRRLLSCASDEERAIIEERLASFGASRISDIEEVRVRIVHQARLLEEKGRVVIVRGEGKFVY